LQQFDTYAVLDLGSNSFHLITARVVNDLVQPLFRQKKLVSLASGLDQNGRLSEQAIQRGLDVLKSFATSIENIDATKIRLIATYTLRQAKNRNDFIVRAKNILPLPIEVISGKEEARLIYQGVAHNSHLAHSMFNCKNLVIDIGGGSTEFALGEGFEVLHSDSLNMGGLVYYQKYIKEGKITKKNMLHAKRNALHRLEVIAPILKQHQWNNTIGTSSTFELIANYFGQFDKDDEPVITYSLLQAVFEDIIAKGHINNLQLQEEGRERVFPGGVAIVMAVFELLQIDSLTCCDFALREGAIYELAQFDTESHIVQRTLKALQQNYEVDRKQADRVATTASRLLQQVKHLFHNQEDAIQIMQWASQLLEIGNCINSKKVHRHSAYIIKHIHMPGFSREMQHILSFLLRFHRKVITAKAALKSHMFNANEMTMLLVILRLSSLIHISRVDDFPPQLQLKVAQDIDTLHFELRFTQSWLTKKALMVEDLRKEIKYLQNIGVKLQVVMLQ